MMKRALVLIVASMALMCTAGVGLSVAKEQDRLRFVLHMDTNPLVSAFQDMGFRIVAKEIWQYQTQGMGDKAPPSSAWEIFTQLEFQLDKRGNVISVRTMSGTQLQGLANRLLGMEIRRTNGADRVFGRFWLLRHPAASR